MFQKLKTLDVERIDMDEAIELLAVANVMRATYDAEQVEVPEWLDNATRDIKREIKNRQSDDKSRRLKELRARRESLATPEEKRNKIDLEIKQLEEATK